MHFSLFCELLVHPVYLLASVTGLRICARMGGMLSHWLVSYHLPSAPWGQASSSLVWVTPAAS